MPLVRIDLIKGRDNAALRSLLDVLHSCVLEAFGVPERDRFQIVTEHSPQHMIIQDVGLGFDRSRDMVVVQITTTPRSLTARKTFYRIAAARLQKSCNLSPDDLMVNFVTVSESDWSFGQGRPQFLTGEL